MEPDVTSDPQKDLGANENDRDGESNTEVLLNISVGMRGLRLPLSAIASVVITSVKEVFPTALSHMEAHRLTSVLTRNIEQLATDTNRPGFPQVTKSRTNIPTLREILCLFQTNSDMPSEINDYPENLRDLRMETKLPEKLSDAFGALKATGDGNCFWNTLSLALLKTEAFHKNVKMLVLHEFKEHEAEIKAMFETTNMDFFDLKKRLTTEDAYSNSDVIFIASQAFNRKINVYNETSVYVYNADPSKSELVPAINIFYQGDPTHHFFPLLEKSKGASSNLQIKSLQMFKNITSRYTYVSFKRRTKAGKKSETIDTSIQNIIVDDKDSSVPIDLSMTEEKIFSSKNLPETKPFEAYKSKMIICSLCCKFYSREEAIKFANVPDSEETFVCKNCILFYGVSEAEIELQTAGSVNKTASQDVTGSIPSSSAIKPFGITVIEDMPKDDDELQNEEVPTCNEPNADDMINLKTKKDKTAPTLSKRRAAKILGVDVKKCNIPKKFSIWIASRTIDQIFDFKTKRFKGNEWAAAFSEQIGKIVMCSFNAKSSPDYLVRTFCKMRGKCGGNCNVSFQVISRLAPKQEMPHEFEVHTKGSATLHQNRPTGRPLKGKRVRSQMAKRLRGVSAEKVHLQLLNSTAKSPIKLLHNNMPHRSSATLRKIKSEDKLKSRTSLDPVEDLRNTAIKFRESIKGSEKVSGFVHGIDDNPDLTFYLYDNTSIGLHSNIVKNESTTVFLDATGSVVQPFKGKKVLTFMLVAEGGPGQYYNVAEMVTSDLTRHSVVKFLKEIRRKVGDFGKSNDKFCDVAVCDFSLPIIHGYIEGLCDCQMKDYFHHSWKVLTDPTYSSNRPVIYICSAHIIRAFQRNLRMKVKNVSNPNKVRNMSLHSIAKLMQCVSLKDFEDVSRAIIKLFNRERLPVVERKETCRFLTSKGIFPDYTDDFIKSKTEKFDFDDAKKDRETLREHSEFFLIFRRLIADEKEIQSSENDPVNEYKCEIVTDALLKTYIPFYPFWSCYMVINLKDSTFIGKTNAAVEAQFKIKKSILEASKTDTYSMYVEKANLHFAKNIEKVLKFSRISQKSRRKNTPTSQGKFTKKNTGKPTQNKKQSQRRKRKLSDFEDDPLSQVREEWNTSKPPKAPVFFGRKLFEQACQNEHDTQYVEVLCEDNEEDETHAQTIPQLHVHKHQQLAEVGDYILTFKDFAALFNDPYEVEDRQMDIYMQYLLNKAQARLSCFVTESCLISKYVIQEADPKLKTPAIIGWVHADDDSFNRIASAYNKQGYILHPLLVMGHWILLRFLLLAKTCIIYNSSHGSSTKKLETEIRKEVLPCIEKLCGISANKKIPWIIEYCTVQQQTDQWSCGYYVLHNSETIMHVRDIDFSCDIIAKRNEIVRNLLGSTKIGNELLNTIGPEEDVEKLIKNIVADN